MTFSVYLGNAAAHSLAHEPSRYLVAHSVQPKTGCKAFLALEVCMTSIDIDTAQVFQTCSTKEQLSCLLKKVYIAFKKLLRQTIQNEGAEKMQELKNKNKKQTPKHADNLQKVPIANSQSCKPEQRLGLAFQHW